MGRIYTPRWNVTVAIAVGVAALMAIVTAVAGSDISIDGYRSIAAYAGPEWRVQSTARSWTASSSDPASAKARTTSWTENSPGQLVS